MPSSLPINLHDLLRRRTVEGERIEYKAGWNPDPILRTLCAFANDFENLGGEVFVSSGREDCGMEVVRHLVQERHDVGAIIVHSFNGVAAREMEARLREAGYSVTRQLFGGREFYRVIEMLTR